MDDESEIQPPSKLKAIIPYVAVLGLGLGGGYGVSFAMGANPAGEAVDPEDVALHGEAPGEAEEPDAEPAAEGEHGAPAEHGTGKQAFAAGMNGKSAVTNLGTFTVNLRGSGGGRVVRMEVQLDSDGHDAKALGTKTPQLRDSVISAVSDYTWSELEGVDGKTRLRDELLQRVNGIASPNEVNALYFTQFVVQ